MAMKMSRRSLLALLLLPVGVRVAARAPTGSREKTAVAKSYHDPNWYFPGTYEYDLNGAVRLTAPGYALAQLPAPFGSYHVVGVPEHEAWRFPDLRLASAVRLHPPKRWWMTSFRKYTYRGAGLPSLHLEA